MESKARLFLAEYDRQSSEKCFNAANANWNYATDIRDETEKIKLQKSLENSKFQKEAWKNITIQFKTRENFQDPVLVRTLKKIAIIGTSASALPEERLKEVNSCTKMCFTMLLLKTFSCSSSNFKTQCRKFIAPQRHALTRM